jgi:tetratricopeptide (TPR) repeat protein
MSTSDRSIRVFLSSTFRDMQAEREELVKQVLPQVRAACEARGVAFSEVDLRWGVSDEQKAEGAVLPICLAEIERSRPYFIGMLGDRYGWVPDEVPADLTRQLGWLGEDAGRSVTELEILHGVLRNPSADGHAFFYLRDPAYLDTVDPAAREALVESSEDGRRRLVELKDRIRGGAHPWHEYRDPRHLGELVRTDLLALLDRRFPAEAVPDRWARVRAEHAAHGVARHGLHVERPAQLEALDAWLAGDGPALVVAAPAGGGASALATRWAARHGDANPADVVVVHHVEASGESADWASLAERLVAELAPIGDGGEPAPPPGTPGVARAAIAEAARSVAAGGRRAVVVLDGVDALADQDGAPDLTFLPAELPAGVRLLLTARSGGRAAVAAEARGWARHEVPPLDDAERRAVSERTLAVGAKTLDAVHLDALAAAPQTGNPLYLRAVLDELRQHGDHFTLGEVLGRLLAAPDLDALVGLLLDRWVADFERDRPGLVGEALTLLASARHGLGEAELLDLLGPGEEPLPHAVWSPLHLAAEAHLVRRSGLLAPAHPSLRWAIEQRWLTDADAKRAVHARLAASFGAAPAATPRVLDELPWACAGAGAWDRLVGCLADGPFLLALTERDPLAPRRLWQRAEAEGGRSMAAAYLPLTRSATFTTAAELKVGFTAAAMLLLAGHLPAAFAIQERLVAGYREVGDGPGLRGALVNLAAGRFQGGEHAAALLAAEEAVALSRAAGDERRLEPALNTAVLVLTALHRGDEAMALSAEEEALVRTRDDPVALAGCLGARGGVRRSLGDPDGALALFVEQERLNVIGGDPVGAAQAIGAQAIVLGDRGDHAGAVAKILEQEAVLREVGARADLTTAMLNRAWHLQGTGDTETAALVIGEAEAMARAAGRWSEVARVLVLRAGGALASGDLATAEALATEAADHARRLADHDRLGAALQVLVACRRTAGDLGGAGTHLLEQEQVYTATGSTFGLANVAGGRGDLAAVAGDLTGALAHWAQAEAGYRQVGEIQNLRTLLTNRVQVRQALGDAAGLLADQRAWIALTVEVDPATARQAAMSAYQELSQAGRGAEVEPELRAVATASARLGDAMGQQAALGDLALLLITTGRFDEADAVLDEQEAICRGLGEPGLAGLQACVGNRGILRRQQGRHDEALAALDEQAAICNRTGNAQGALMALANRGDVLAQIPGRTADARAAFTEARQTAQQFGLTPMVAQLDQMLAALPPG